MQKLNYELSLTVNGHKFSLEHGKAKELDELLEIISDNEVNEEEKKDDVLCWACKNGIFKLAKFMIDSGADINSDRNFPMKIAISNGHTEIVQLLISAGVDIKEDNQYLLKAIQKCQVKIVEILIENGIDVTLNGNEALQLAIDLAINKNIVNQEYQIPKLLIDAGADIHACRNEVFKWACSIGEIDTVKLLLKTGDTSIDKEYGLISASENGHIEIVKLLIKSNADIDTSHGKPLNYAGEEGHIEVVKILLEAGANPNACNGILYNPCVHGYTEIVKLLIKYGVSVSISAIEGATMNKRTEIVEILESAWEKQCKKE